MDTELDNLVSLMPFAAHLGIRLVEATPERVVAELDHAPHLCTAGGIMHGGALMALGDSVGAVVTFLGLPAGASTSTATSTTQLFRPVAGGTVRAVGTPVNRGRTMVTAQTDLYDGDDRLVARVTQVQAVR
jgi:1,4-dihydroxy-2-naphthoyl-CoA hydrolase